MTCAGQASTIWRWPLDFSGSMMTRPSSRRYTAPPSAASRQLACSQWAQSTGVYCTFTSGVLPRVCWSTRHQNWPVSGCSAAMGSQLLPQCSSLQAIWQP